MVVKLTSSKASFRAAITEEVTAIREYQRDGSKTDKKKDDITSSGDHDDHLLGGVDPPERGGQGEGAHAAN